MEPGQDNPIGTGKRVRDISAPTVKSSTKITTSKHMIDIP